MAPQSNEKELTTKGELINSDADLERLSLDSLRKAIPKEAFVKDLSAATYYLVRDLAGAALGLAGLFAIQDLELQPVAYWSASAFCWMIEGVFMWCLFVVGHDCGHGTFSNYTWLNDFVGNIVHGLIMVPYWPWRLSHRRHHMYHNHIDKDYSHPWWTDERAEADPVGHKLVVLQDKHPIMKLIFPIIGWPVYLLGLPDGSHFFPNKSSRLWANTAFHESVKAIVSTACVVGCTYGMYAWLGSLANLVYYHLVPVLIMGWWLVCTTYLQHHSEETVVYGNENWKFDLAAFQTVDREFGWGVDQLTHHITDGHVAHHLFFTKIPHYNLPMATKAIQKHMEAIGLKKLYRKEKTHNFPVVLYDHMLRFGFKTHEIMPGDALHPSFAAKKAL